MTTMQSFLLHEVYFEKGWDCNRAVCLVDHLAHVFDSMRSELKEDAVSCLCLHCRQFAVFVFMSVLELTG